MATALARTALRRSAVALVVVATVLGASEIWAADAAAVRDAQRLLMRMDDVIAQQNYDGVFTYRRGDSTTTFRIVHAVIGGVQHERLSHLEGRPREVVRIGSRVVVVLSPDDELAELIADLPAGPLARAFVRNYRSIPRQYRIVPRGGGRIAGRDARAIGIEPTDRERLAHELWIDEATGMLLKSQLVDLTGVPLEVFQVMQISLGRAIPAREFLAPADQQKVLHDLSPAAGARAAQAPVSWRVGWLPAGFTMATQTQRAGAGGDAGLQTLFYGDGLVGVSVFIERLPPSAALSANKQVMREGATVAVSVGAADRAGRAHLVTVVGEIPVATAERIARSVKAR